MRFFFAEFANVYSTYTFAYAPYAIADDVRELPEIYGRGFLPYSGDPTETSEVFYMARSVRVDLAQFTETSENRRIARKMEPLAPQMSLCPRASFDFRDPHFLTLCKSCASERFSPDALSDERFAYILERDCLTHVVVVRTQGTESPIGYVLCAQTADILHYWFAFYDTQFSEFGLGKWMMGATLRLCQEAGLRYAYLGTAYGAKALYKTADFRGVEWFDGRSWNPDTKALATLCRSEDVSGTNQPAFLPQMDAYKRERVAARRALENEE